MFLILCSWSCSSGRITNPVKNYYLFIYLFIFEIKLRYAGVGDMSSHVAWHMLGQFFNSCLITKEKISWGPGYQFCTPPPPNHEITLMESPYIIIKILITTAFIVCSSLNLIFFDFGWFLDLVERSGFCYRIWILEIVQTKMQLTNWMVKNWAIYIYVKKNHKLLTAFCWRYKY